MTPKGRAMRKPRDVEPIKGNLHVCTVTNGTDWWADCLLWDGDRWLFWENGCDPAEWSPVTEINCMVEDWDFPTMVAPVGSTSDVIMDLRDERLRQKAKLGWTEAHDDNHADGFLAILAAAKALCATRDGHFDTRQRLASYFASFGIEPEHIYNGSFRDLLKEAGALIIAEMERLDRITPPKRTGKGKK